MSAEVPRVEPRCPACGQPLGPQALFCSRCGAGATDGEPADAAEDPLERAVLAEAAEARAHGRSVAGLLVALASYALVLLVSFAPAFVTVERMSDYRVFDVLISVVGVLGMAVTFGDSRELLRLPRVTLAGVGLTVLGMALVLGVAHVMLTLVPSGDDQLLAAYRAEGYGLGMVLFDVSVLPGVGEELVFRAVILSGFLKVLQARNAVIVSALLFATIHLSPLSFLHLTVMGIVLGTLRTQSGSIYPCILCHAAYNTAVVLFAWW